MDRLNNVGMKHERITLTFDQDFGFARRRLGIFEELKKRSPVIRERLAQSSFADSHTFYPLQASDMLAWETRRQLVNRAGGHESTKRWRELTAALPLVAFSSMAASIGPKRSFRRDCRRLPRASHPLECAIHGLRAFVDFDLAGRFDEALELFRVVRRQLGFARHVRTIASSGGR